MTLLGYTLKTSKQENFNPICALEQDTERQANLRGLPRYTPVVRELPNLQPLKVVNKSFFTHKALPDDFNHDTVLRVIEDYFYRNDICRLSLRDWLNKQVDKPIHQSCIVGIPTSEETIVEVFCNFDTLQFEALPVDSDTFSHQFLIVPNTVPLV